jgi:hypothetical protein
MTSTDGPPHIADVWSELSAGAQAEVREWFERTTRAERHAEWLVGKSDAELHRLSAHPDWEYTLTEGPRKAWDYEDVPPPGEGWVRNVEVGRDGWNRFDYTEESYWRRPKIPPGRRARQTKASSPA